MPPPIAVPQVPGITLSIIVPMTMMVSVRIMKTNERCPPVARMSRALAGP